MATIVLQEYIEDAVIDPTKPLVDVYHVGVLLYSPKTKPSSMEHDSETTTLFFAKGDYDNHQLLDKLTDDIVREMVSTILNLDGVESLNVDTYALGIFYGTAFDRDEMRVKIFNILRASCYPNIELIEYISCFDETVTRLIRFVCEKNKIVGLSYGKLRMPRTANKQKKVKKTEAGTKVHTA